MRTQKQKRLYWIWADMLSRCRNPSHRAFRNYGARGIAVCEHWRSFPAFVEDMGERPEGYLLDRQDNDKGYEPDNCRWVTRHQQNGNRRNCIYVDCDGERVCVKEACRRKGLLYRPVMKRIRDRGWSVERALSLPIRPIRRKQP